MHANISNKAWVSKREKAMEKAEVNLFLIPNIAVYEQHNTFYSLHSQIAPSFILVSSLWFPFTYSHKQLLYTHSNHFLYHAISYPGEIKIVIIWVYMPGIHSFPFFPFGSICGTIISSPGFILVIEY